MIEEYSLRHEKTFLYNLNILYSSFRWYIKVYKIHFNLEKVVLYALPNNIQF